MYVVTVPFLHIFNIPTGVQAEKGKIWNGMGQKKFEMPGMSYRRYASGWWRRGGDVMQGTKSGVGTRTGSDADADHTYPQEFL